MVQHYALEIGYWVYTIGPKGGLYHQVKGSKNPPKRIHNSHPPIEHQERVREWQNEYVSTNGLALPKRYNPNNPLKPQITLIDLTDKKSIPKKKKPSMNKKQSNPHVSHKKQSKRHSSNKKKTFVISSEAKKFSKKKSTNLNVQQIEILINEPTFEKIFVTEEETKKSQFAAFPSTIDQVKANLNKLQICTNQKFVPDWVITNETKLTTYNETYKTNIYYSSDITLIDAQHYTTERLVSKDHTTKCDFGFTESYYSSLHSISPMRGLLGFYSQCDITVNDEQVKINAFQAAEPLLEENTRLVQADITKQYEQIFAKLALCARNFTTVCIQIGNTLNPKFLDVMKSVLLNLFSTVIPIKLETIGTVKLETKTNYESLQEAVEKQKLNLESVLFASLCDMRFVISTSMFESNLSSLPLHIYGLTNMNLKTEANFIVV